jgi:hypothetical protein
MNIAHFVAIAVGDRRDVELAAAHEGSRVPSRKNPRGRTVTQLELFRERVAPLL